MKADFLRRFRFWVLLLHLLAGGYQLLHQRIYLVDSAEYSYAADNLMASGRLYSGDLDAPFRPELLTKRPPLYPALLGLMRRLSGSDWGMLALQVLLSLLNCELAFRLALRFRPQMRPWRWLLLLALTPAQALYAVVLMAEIPLQTALLGLLWAYAEWDRSGRTRWLWLGAGALIAAMLLKPVWYLFSLVWLLWAGAGALRRRRFAALPAAALPLLVMAGYIAWNGARTGYPHFSSIQNLSLMQYSAQNLLISLHGQETGTALADSIWFAAKRQPDFAAQERFLQQECTAVIRAHPLRYAALHLKGMANFFLDPGRFDLYTFFGWQRADAPQGLLAAFSQNGYAGIWAYLRQQQPAVLLLLMLILAANAAKLLLTALWAFQPIVPLTIRLFWLALMAYPALLTGPSGASRFLVPTGLLMIAAAAMAGLPRRKA